MTNQKLADLLGGTLSWMPDNRNQWVPAILLPSGLKVIIDTPGGAMDVITRTSRTMGEAAAVKDYLAIADANAQMRIDGGETKENLGGVNDLNRPWLPPYPTTPPPSCDTPVVPPPPPPSPAPQPSNWLWNWFTSLFRGA